MAPACERVRSQGTSSKPDEYGRTEGDVASGDTEYALETFRRGGSTGREGGRSSSDRLRATTCVVGEEELANSRVRGKEEVEDSDKKLMIIACG